MIDIWRAWCKMCAFASAQPWECLATQLKSWIEFFQSTVQLAWQPIQLDLLDQIIPILWLQVVIGQGTCGKLHYLEDPHILKTQTWIPFKVLVAYWSHLQPLVKAVGQDSQSIPRGHMSSSRISSKAALLGARNRTTSKTDLFGGHEVIVQVAGLCFGLCLSWSYL